MLRRMGDVDELTGLSVLLGTLALLGGLLLRGLHVRKRLLSSGRRLCAVRLLRDGTKLVATPRVSITAPGEPCRLMLALRIDGRYEQRGRPFRGRVAMVTGTPYALAISDRAGRVLYQERERLDRFRMWFRSRSSSATSLSRERSSWTDQGTAPILELVPREAGVYQVSLEIEAREEVHTQWSSSSCEVLEAELIAAEGVEPFSRFARYPHRRVEL